MSSGTSPTACALTVMEAHGGIILAKRWNADGSATPYGNARTVTLHPRRIAGLPELFDGLRELLTLPRLCVVRGEPTDPAHVSRVRRLLHPDPETGEAPTLREVVRRWVAIDVDSVPVPAGTDLLDLAACTRAVLPVLPRAFHSVSCIVNATASHGIKPGVRLRLWFWLSRPTNGAELLAWFKGAPIDTSTFRAAQPIYTAAPLFHDGADPLPSRLAMLTQARAVVDVPAAETLIPPRPDPSQARGGLGLVRLGSGAPAMRFAALLNVVRSAAEGERHPKLLWAALKAHEIVQAGAITETSARDALVKAAMDAGGVDKRNAEKTAEYGLKHGPRGAA